MTGQSALSYQLKNSTIDDKQKLSANFVTGFYDTLIR